MKTILEVKFGFSGRILAVLGFLLVLSAPGVVRGQNATITGTVTDPSHSAVAGASVTARNTETNASRAAQSIDNGTFRIVDLVPGIYEVVVEKSGFKSLRFSNLVLTVSQSYTLDAILEVSSVSATIEVNAQSLPSVELDNASISNVVDQRHIEDLPLITRDPYQLVLLSPGVVTTTGNGGFSVNGQRDRNNNFLLDGVDNNDTSVPGIPGGITSLNPDSAQEFRVITNNFLPEYGRNTGAIIEVITKSGTNDFHGTAYWYGRYTATAARDFFNHNTDFTGQVEPENPFVRNTFGGSAGGKIIKDKTFWFANYDGSRYVTTLTNQTTVPTAGFKAGVFTFDPGADAGGPVPVDISSPASAQNATGAPLDPTIAKILALYPAANAGATAVDSVRGLYRFGSTSRSNSDNFTAKVDHNFNAKEVLSVRYTFNRTSDPNAFHSDFLPGGLDAVAVLQRTQNASAGLTSTLTSTLVNDFHAGFNRTNLPFTCTGTNLFNSFGLVDPQGRGADYALSGLNTFGCGTLGDSNGQARHTGTYTAADNISWARGKHSFKFGGEFRDIYENGFNDFGSRDTLGFNVFSVFGAPSINLDPASPCDYNEQFIPSDPTQIQFRHDCGSVTLQNMGWLLTGIVATQNQSQFFNKSGAQTPDDAREFRQKEMRLFVQDAWKVKSNLTLSLGLAWAYYGVPYETHNNLSNLFADPSGFAPFTFSIVGPGTGKQLFNDYYKNFEPRIGVAWDPFKKGTTSIRAGYGIFHDRVFGNLFGNARGNVPFEQDVANFPGDFLSNITVPQPQVASATVTDGAFITPDLFDINYRSPTTQSWNLGVQRDTLAGFTVEMDYVGSHSTHLFRVVDGNPPQPALVAQNIANGTPPGQLTGSRLWTGGPGLQSVNNTAFFQATFNKSIANAIYHGLQIKVSQRPWHGMQLGGAYTFSHAIDDASDPIVPGAGNRAFPRNSFNLLAERGNSDFDVRHHAVINYIYELPFGRGKAYVNNGFAGRLLEGWQVSGITTLSGGSPYDIFGNRDTQHTGLSDRAELVGNPSIPAGSDKTQTGPPLSAFGFAALGSASNLGRNHFYGPGTVVFDMVVQKTMSLTERLKLQFRTEGYNLFNHVTFGQPDNLIADTNTFGISTSQVGRADGTSGARQLQFALRLKF